MQVGLLFLSIFLVLQGSVEKFAALDKVMNCAIENGVFPGGVLFVGYKGSCVYHKAFGHFTYDASSSEVTVNTLYDCASITKIVAPVLMAMKLYEENLLDIKAPVAHYVSEFAVPDKATITIEDLLLHQSGLRQMDELPIHAGVSHDAIKKMCLHEPSFEKPGTVYRYNCLNMILLQWIMEEITGVSLEQYINEHLFKPLHMENSYMHVPEHIKAQCAPTGRGYEKYEAGDREFIQGTVHDYKAHCLGGYAGNAGLFSTAGDLALFIDMIRCGGKGIIKESTINYWLQKHSTLPEQRALGWATAPDHLFSCGHLFSENSYGHLGFTGTSLWWDRDKDIYVILLTNRVYPVITNTKIWQLRTDLHDAVVQCLMQN